MALQNMVYEALSGGVAFGVVASLKDAAIRFFALMKFHQMLDHIGLAWKACSATRATQWIIDSVQKDLGCCRETGLSSSWRVGGPL